MNRLLHLMLAVVIFTMCKSIKPDALPPEASNSNEASVVANETRSNQTGKVVEESSMATNTNADSVVVSGQELVPELDALKRDKLPEAIIAEIAAIGRMKPIKNTEFYTNGQIIIGYTPVLAVPPVVSDLFPSVVFYYLSDAYAPSETKRLSAFAFHQIWSPVLTFNKLLEKQGRGAVDVELKIEALLLLFNDLEENTTVVVKPKGDGDCYVAHVVTKGVLKEYSIKTVNSRIISFDIIEDGVRRNTVILYD